MYSHGSRVRPLGLAALIVLILGALVAAPGALAAPSANDNFANATPLDINNPADTVSTLDNTAGTADTTLSGGFNPEPLVPASEGGDATRFCQFDQQDPSTIRRMHKTAWYKFTGNGGFITVSTRASSFDTMLVVYNSAGTGILCSNNAGLRASAWGATTSEVAVPTQNGATYYAQVGGCLLSDGTVCPPIAGEPSGDGGSLNIIAYNQPPNDNRASAANLTSDNSLDNLGATTENGETTTIPANASFNCNTQGSNGRIDTVLGKTDWWKYHAATKGTLTVEVTPASDPNLDSVVAVYPANSNTPIACNDDFDPQNPGGSRVSVPNLPAGDYFVQVGGYGSGQSASDGLYHIASTFTPNPDQDGDGFASNGTGVNRDCNDTDPNIHPGAKEISGNRTDENCDGVIAFDRDGDGAAGNYVAAKLPRFVVSPSKAPAFSAKGKALRYDCNDLKKSIHVGAFDIPGNHIDENCNGRDAKKVPVSVGSLKWHFHYSPAPFRPILDLLRFESIEGGAKIVVHCIGGGRNCPGHATRNVGKRRKHNFSILSIVSGHPFPRTGTVLVVTVSRQYRKTVQLTFKISRKGGFLTFNDNNPTRKVLR